MKKKLKILIAGIGLVLLIPISIHATTIKVPQDSATIQLAIDAAVDGDTVLVAEGTYVENISFNGKDIMVASLFITDGNLEHITSTIIDGSSPSDVNKGSTVSFNSGETRAATLIGFTIQKGRGTLTLNNKWIEGAGIIIENSAATIKFNLIKDNENVVRSGATGGGGGGISSIRSNPVISNNVILNNTSGYAGGIVLNWSGGIIRNNIIFKNSSTGSWGSGGIMVWNAPEVAGNPPQIVENNTIIGNSATTTAGGISIDKTANPAVVKNLIIWGNTQATGGQLKNNEYGKVSYSNIEGGFTGTGNINSEPIFLSQFELGEGSPCIDAGDTSEIYKDIPNDSDMLKALNPSQGTCLNDMGAYGGPYAADLPPFEISEDYLNGSSHVTSVDKILDTSTLGLNVFPNPSCEIAVLEYELKNNSTAVIDLFDQTGRHVMNIRNLELAMGSNSTELDVSDLNNGLYVLRLRTHEEQFLGKLLISR